MTSEAVAISDALNVSDVQSRKLAMIDRAMKIAFNTLVSQNPWKMDAVANGTPEELFREQMERIVLASQFMNEYVIMWRELGLPEFVHEDVVTVDNYNEQINQGLNTRLKACGLK